MTDININTVLILITGILAFINNERSKVIHVLVNSKMSAALDEIEKLKGEVKQLKESALKEPS